MGLHVHRGSEVGPEDLDEVRTHTVLDITCIICAYVILRCVPYPCTIRRDVCVEEFVFYHRRDLLLFLHSLHPIKSGTRKGWRETSNYGQLKQKEDLGVSCSKRKPRRSLKVLSFVGLIFVFRKN